MYIIAIAWLYVVFMMSITERSATAGVATFLLYGVFPLSVVLYLMGTPQRKRNRENRKKMEATSKEASDNDEQGKREGKTESPDSGKTTG